MHLRLLLYTGYAVFVFSLTCIFVIPTLIVLGQKRQWHNAALRLHTYWAKIFFTVVLKVEVIGKEKLNPDQQYIFCVNHFSFLDIPAFYLLYPSKFIGKSSLTKIPLFGYFFKKIHIPVNRSSARSRAESFQKTKDELDDGFNITFFPEGGIVVKEEGLPYMTPFKDGAFRLSVEKGIPIVPVTMPYNFLILPDRSPVRFHPHKCTVIVHDPVFPKSKDEKEAVDLKSKVFDTIQAELLRHHPDKVRAVN